MATFRSFSEIVATMLRRLQLTQPNLDTKPGSVSRDLFVDIPADQISRLYSAINLVSQKQSLASTSGSDLDKLGSNFGTVRNTGSAANGIVVFCVNSIVEDIPIPSGTLITSRGGITFRTIGNFVMSSVDRNRLSANAARMQKGLNIAGLNSKYALEVPVQAVRNGVAGNVSSLQLISTNLDETVSVTNLTSMSGGANSESDESFRSRILSIFSGANIGTSFGYRNALMGVNGVVDALIVEPGSSLMLRDGTETMALQDGSSRILNSGTGGKVDAYILGRKIEEVADSFIYTDLSGSGDATDDRNSYILGQSTQDMTRTSEERRVLAFKQGNIPSQPVDSIVTVSGSSSGILTEQFVDLDGNTKGNFVLEKDLNPETGGSPFGFDKIRFISNVKEVVAESIVKGEGFALEPLSFEGIDYIGRTYVDISETNENSMVSSAGSQYIQLLHSPVVKVSKVVNKTTGEVYSVVSQEVNSENINESGVVEISGKSLPSAADVLSVNYIWRHIFDPYIDYVGAESVTQFSDKSNSDVIDWSSGGGIFEEEAKVRKSSDGLVHEIDLEKNIVRVLSVYKKEVAQSVVSEVDKIGLTSIVGIELSLDSEYVKNIISIRRASDNLEIYNTKQADGSFNSRIIYLPSDSSIDIGDEVVVHYNKVELYDVENTDGSFYNNTCTLPSDSVLGGLGLLEDVELAYFSSDSVYATYIADTSSVYQKTNLSNLPIISTETTNSLVALDNFNESLSNQPIAYNFDSLGGKSSINRFGAAPLSLDVSGISAPGKIKVSGESLLRLSIHVQAGTSLSGDTISLNSELKEAFSLDSLPDSIGIARVDRVALLDSDGNVEHDYDVLGSSLKDNRFSIGSAKKDSELKVYELKLPNTPVNNLASPSSSDTILLNILAYNLEDYEEVYFDSPSNKITTKRFGRISSISVSSGFRTGASSLLGSIAASSITQPATNSTYYVDYSFLAPKEGERITVSYNVNKLIIDATASIEQVRPITADILVKEAEELLVNVSGTIMVNENALSEAGRIADAVTNAVTNMLNTASLGSVVDYSDVISVAASQNGVDSVNISLFNQDGKSGRKPFIKALDNQTISPGTVSFEVVSRSKFRIN